jgi:alpha-galactosidase
VDVYLDDQFQATVDANAAGVHHLGNQALFSKTGLKAGQHTLQLVKRSGVYMLLDALVINS